MSVTMRVPFHIGHTGRIAKAEGEYDVANQYLKTLLLTRFNERVMRPHYGSRVRDNVFEPVGDVMLQTLEGDIRDAVKYWEPAIAVHGVIAEDRGSLVDIEIQYTVGSTLGEPPTTTRVTIDVGGTVEETQ